MLRKFWNYDRTIFKRRDIFEVKKNIWQLPARVVGKNFSGAGDIWEGGGGLIHCGPPEKIL